MPPIVNRPAQSAAEINPGSGWPVILAADFTQDRAVPDQLTGAAIEAALSVAAQKAIAWLQSRDPAQPALTALESVDFTQGVYWLALAELAPRFPRYFAKRPDGADFGELEGARRHYETEARGCLARIAGFAAPPVIGCHQLGPKE